MAPTELYALNSPVRRSLGEGGSTINKLLAISFLKLLLRQFDLSIDHLVGETVDGEVYPVMLFPFHNEIVLETGVSISLVVAGLGYQIN